MAEIPRSPALSDEHIPKYKYIPIYEPYAKREIHNIIGWQLDPPIPNWRPQINPPRVIDHYHLQYYSCTYNNERMVLNWTAYSAGDVAFVMLSV